MSEIREAVFIKPQPRKAKISSVEIHRVPDDDGGYAVLVHYDDGEEPAEKEFRSLGGLIAFLTEKLPNMPARER